MLQPSLHEAHVLLVLLQGEGIAQPLPVLVPGHPPLSNEITAASAVDEDLLENHRLLNELCHKLDPTRPTTMANVFMLDHSQGRASIMSSMCSW